MPSTSTNTRTHKRGEKKRVYSKWETRKRTGRAVNFHISTNTDTQLSKNKSKSKMGKKKGKECRRKVMVKSPAFHNHTYTIRKRRKCKNNRTNE